MVIIFPVKFGDNIVNSETVRRWDFDWTYGFAWGALIFSVGATIFFFLPGDTKAEARLSNASYSSDFARDT